jgi:hypothetical protein
MSVPHGLLGKAYAATALIGAAVIMTAVAFAIILAPDWVIYLIFAGMVAAFIAFTIFIKWQQRARRY